MAAPRDAAYYKRPDTRTTKVFHIATTDWTGACQPGPDFAKGLTPLDDSLQVREPATIYDDLRCRRPGCRVWWAKVPSKPRGGTK